MVGSSDLENALRERGGHAYLISVTDQGGPHAIYVPVRYESDEFVAEVGARTAAFAAARPRVSLLYPVRSVADHTLFVDGLATVEDSADGPRVRVKPTRIVLHRSAPGSDPDAACDSDCMPIAIDST